MSHKVRKVIELIKLRKVIELIKLRKVRKVRKLSKLSKLSKLLKPGAVVGLRVYPKPRGPTSRPIYRISDQNFRCHH